MAHVATEFLFATVLAGSLWVIGAACGIALDQWSDDDDE